MTDTIFFDVGNTLRIVIPDKAFSDAAEKELMELVGATERSWRSAGKSTAARSRRP